MTIQLTKIYEKINHLKAKNRLSYLKTQFLPRSKHIGYENKSVYVR
jgi:hypothetical protein